MSDNWRARGERSMPRRSERFGAPSLAPQTLEEPKVALPPTVRSARALRRTADMVEAFRQIDLAPSQAGAAEIVEWLKGIYDDRRGGPLVGLFSHCYLGHPYVDHALNMDHGIVDHFRAGDPVPPVYLGARPLASSEAYAYIEIYADGQVIPVRTDGSPAA